MSRVRIEHHIPRILYGVRRAISVGPSLGSGFLDWDI